MHHAVISDSEVEVITSAPLPFFSSSLPPSAQLSGQTLLCQPSIWWLETTHFIAVTRHDGAARPEPLDLFPAPRSSTPPSERQCVGRLASLLICHGWTAGEALTPRSSGSFFISVGFVMRPQLPAAMFHILTRSVLSLLGCGISFHLALSLWT